MIKLILACDYNYGIGNNNDILYSFSSDLKRFKDLTKNKTIVMGRKTWESLPGKLPNRKHVVLTRNNNLKLDKVDLILNSIDDIIKMSENEDIWIIGGAEIYKQFCSISDVIELTYIHGTKNCDTDVKFMKELLLEFEIKKMDSLNDIDRMSNKQYKIDFITYEKKKK